jgi:hypothetical protein
LLDPIHNACISWRCLRAGCSPGTHYGRGCVRKHGLNIRTAGTREEAFCNMIAQLRVERHSKSSTRKSVSEGSSIPAWVAFQLLHPVPLPVTTCVTLPCTMHELYESYTCMLYIHMGGKWLLFDATRSWIGIVPACFYSVGAWGSGSD